ncbi:MAG: C-GCAxxG-C-C family protein [Solirubrobacterales bacterium]
MSGPSDPRKTGDAAAAHFQGGLYCAESVLLALADHLGVNSDALPAIATGFCGGMSRTRGPCGALTGAVMGLGLAYGRDRGDQGVDQNYRAVQALARLFEGEFGAIGCVDLLGCDLGTEEGREKFRSEGLSARCLGFTRRAAEIAAELIDTPPAANCNKGCGC